MALAAVRAPRPAAAGAPAIRKIEDVLIYRDEKFYCAFPSVVRRPDGELIVAFRRAPERRALGEGGDSHTDPNSQLVLVRSRDGGKTWTQTPELLYAHPFGGSQDPCMAQLADGTILCSSYGWALLQPEAAAKLKDATRIGNFIFMGGYILRSTDGGRHWSEPILPPPTPGDPTLDMFGKPIRAYNRGAMRQGKDGRVYWAVAASTNSAAPGLSSTHLMISDDGGLNWKYSCPIASDEKVAFNETSLHQTPAGDWVAFMRSENFGDRTCIARSTDGGKSFGKWEDAGFQGHPHCALGLPDGRVLLVYGYRHAPYGVRVRTLNADCSDAATAPETILRDDGGNGDLGYPWAAMIDERRVLFVYYFNVGDGLRHIAGTIAEIAN